MRLTSDRHGPNVILVARRAMLLVRTSGGVATHLAAVATEPETGCAAVASFYYDGDGHHDGAWSSRYDRASLTEPRWSPRTLCGRGWAVMVGGEAGAVGGHGGVALAPDCRRCLSLIDRHFPKPAPRARLGLIVELTVDAVVGLRGLATVQSVPGDQQSELRRRVREKVRQRTGHSTRTYVHNSVVYVECDAIYRQHADAIGREVADVMQAALTGEPAPRLNQDWVISWDAWDVG